MKKLSLFLLLCSFPTIGFGHSFDINFHLDPTVSIDVLAGQANSPLRFSTGLTTSSGNYFTTLGVGAQTPDDYYQLKTGPFRFPLTAEATYRFGFLGIGMGGSYSFESGKVIIPVMQNQSTTIGTIESSIFNSQPALNFIVSIYFQETPAAAHHIVYTYSLGFNQLSYTVDKNDSPLNAKDAVFNYQLASHRLEDRLYFQNGLVMNFGIWMEAYLDKPNEYSTRDFYPDAEDQAIYNLQLGGNMSIGMYIGIGYHYSFFGK